MSIIIAKYIFWILIVIPILVLGFFMLKGLVISMKSLVDFDRNEKQRKREEILNREAEAKRFREFHYKYDSEHGRLR